MKSEVVGRGGAGLFISTLNLQCDVPAALLIYLQVGEVNVLFLYLLLVRELLGMQTMHLEVMGTFKSFLVDTEEGFIVLPA